MLLSAARAGKKNLRGSVGCITCTFVPAVTRAQRAEYGHCYSISDFFLHEAYMHLEWNLSGLAFEDPRLCQSNFHRAPGKFKKPVEMEN